MKKLQSNFTTPEQAYEIMRLGVNKSTADCWRQSPTSDIFVRCSEELRPDFFEGTTFIPCWSVGRLIEIYNMCVDFDLDDRAAIVIFIQDESPIVQMMEMFEDKVGIMDFSKL